MSSMLTTQSSTTSNNLSMPPSTTWSTGYESQSVPLPQSEAKKDNRPTKTASMPHLSIPRLTDPDILFFEGDHFTPDKYRHGTPPPFVAPSRAQSEVGNNFIDPYHGFAGEDWFTPSDYGSGTPVPFYLTVPAGMQGDDGQASRDFFDSEHIASDSIGILRRSTEKRRTAHAARGSVEFIQQRTKQRLDTRHEASKSIENNRLMTNWRRSEDEGKSADNEIGKRALTQAGQGRAAVMDTEITPEAQLAQLRIDEILQREESQNQEVQVRIDEIVQNAERKANEDGKLGHRQKNWRS
ncbi:MAG: hypothetical protein M1828_002388 [Chrysothrix sp. TS-e1954]|nr:MAG: hypothetical protein M1828_002388 [Chrysothrix sp. TS-e1954]